MLRSSTRSTRKLHCVVLIFRQQIVTMILQNYKKFTKKYINIISYKIYLGNINLSCILKQLVFYLHNSQYF